MGIRVGLHHRTHYSYDRLVTLGPHEVRLRPAPHCRTPVRSYSLHIEPAQHFINWQQDPHGNFLARLVFPEKTREFTVEVDLVAELVVINPFDFFLAPEANEVPFAYDPDLKVELQACLRRDEPGPLLTEFLTGAPRRAKQTVDFLVDLNQYVHQAVKYVIRLEPGIQTCEETLSRALGSCRDSAWLLVQVLRHHGLAARFVSGYLIQLKPDEKPLEGHAGAAEDFADLHAWAEVYLPGAGWVGLDPTSGLLAGEGHLPLAATPEPSSAAAITGGVDECVAELAFEMTVTRLHEDPRVTRPYTDEQWARIEALGNRVEQTLRNGDVRLTMGGEPTFVSIDDMDSPEWNTAALGPQKRRLAGELFRRMANRFAQGPLLHYGQGKWYPGEQLPRWALGCYWRVDGEPIWEDPVLLAYDDENYGHGEAEAHAFIQALAKRLKVNADDAQAAYEDVWYYLWRERRLPVNVDPLRSNLDEEEERERLARVFERGLSKVVGYVLPLRMRETFGGAIQWESGQWHFRQQRLYLTPGDSPMGYRLPLDSIPWVAAEDRQHMVEADPFVERAPLARYVGNGAVEIGEPLVNGRLALAKARLQMYELVGAASRSGQQQIAGMTPFGAGPAGPPPNGHRRDTPPARGESASNLIRTALCVEARGGMLHVFVPPAETADEYLALIAAIEQTARQLALPVRIEGYTPPFDTRLQHFKVTPDPGVIEVNLQPAASWSELAANTTALYEEARLTRLGTEKFMLDGRHTGTGGGNHVVLGGPKPADSPFLRRPDLLKSIVAYWNSRPSLSYLFSGMFVGPTSQAPRVDEARHESVYELETALAQISEGGNEPPWIVDRVLRNLLVDITGNTHRSEFCIDKLYSPDSSSGRLGLVEFRAFEMPPHARMSLTQQLLVRALVARFWNQPYNVPLVRWGTMLHDRYMLPHFVAQDFDEVLDELNAAGFAFEHDWFAAHFEFRFPLLGEVTYQGVQMELRQAIEPWHVLGEEPGGGGTVRYVDSSVERLQVKVRGLTDSRHIIVCNGRRVPLHPTGTSGEFVAGVRFRAWQPPSCLHPTIGAHVPLVFDVIDTWNRRAIGGCTWRVEHPGGRNSESFPVNAYAAESRRAARFTPTGHTPGPQPIPPEEHNRDYPHTLDMRRPVELATLDGQRGARG